MTKKFQILRTKRFEDIESVPLTPDEYLDALRENRVRIRTFASMVLTGCSVLLSASFVMLFFLLGGANSARLVPVILLFASAATLVLAMTFALLSAKVARPSVVANRGERLEQAIAIYRSEFQVSTFSAACLLLGIVLFLSSLATLAWSTL